MSSITKRRLLTVAREGLAGLFRLTLRVSPGLANRIYENLSLERLRYFQAHHVFQTNGKAFPWTVRLRNGFPLKLQVDPANHHLVGMAFGYKSHDIGLRRMQELLIDGAGPDTLYIDIGANFGVSSLYALSAKMPCLLFEPFDDLRQTGNGIFEANNFRNYRWEMVALSNVDGKDATFYVSTSSYLSSLDYEHASREGEVKQVTVPLRTLDSYLPEIKTTAKSVILKIDVEGHESSVLDGGAQLIDNYRPPVLLELLLDSRTRPHAWEFFSARDYLCFGIRDIPTMNATMLKQPQELYAFEDINYLFIPSDHPVRNQLASLS